MALWSPWAKWNTRRSVEMSGGPLRRCSSTTSCERAAGAQAAIISKQRLQMNKRLVMMPSRNEYSTKRGDLRSPIQRVAQACGPAAAYNWHIGTIPARDAKLALDSPAAGGRISMLEAFR